MRILIADDDPQILRALRITLTAKGYEILTAADGVQAISAAIEEHPDLFLIDLGMPKLDGIDVIHSIRGWSQAPILVVSGRAGAADKVEALDAGADDYVTKPFGVGELLARMRTSLRHANRPAADSTVVSIGDVRVDLAARLVFRANQEVHLTPLEYKLLVTLLKHSGKVLTHRFLLREVWGPQDSQETHYLRVFIASLRRKLEAEPARPRYILTEPGVGYRLVAE